MRAGRGSPTRITPARVSRNVVRGDMSDDVKIRALLAPCQCRSGTCSVLVMTLFELPYFLQVPGSEFIVAEDADTVDSCAEK